MPTFFIVGAPKAGTTSLYRYLRQHPQVYMSPVKEPSYFASEVRPERFSSEYRSAAWKASEKLRQFLDHPVAGAPHPQGIVCNWEDYLKLFRAPSREGAAGETAIGEASVCYLWSETAAANIRQATPDARILMILRDPVERAYSQYLHNARDGVVRGSFREQIERGAGHTLREFQPLYPFLENGLYYAQVKRFLDVFPRERIRILIYEEAWREPERLLLETFEFLQVDPEFRPDLSSRELERRAPRSLTANYLLTKSGAGPRLRALVPSSVRSPVRRLLFKPDHRGAAMPPEDREFLNRFYREDVSRLAELLGRDFSFWL